MAVNLGSLEACKELFKLGVNRDFMVLSLKNVLTLRPEGSEERNGALKALEEVAIMWTEDPDTTAKGANLLLELVDLKQESSRLYLADIGIKENPLLINNLDVTQYSPSEVENYIIGKMLLTGTLVKPDSNKALHFLGQASKVLRDVSTAE